MKKKHTIDFSSDWNLAPAPESTTHFKLKDTYDLFTTPAGKPAS